MHSPSSDPFAFDSFDWANSDSKGTATSPSPVSLRLWAKYLSNKYQGQPTVNIPAEWVDFFTQMLLKDSSCEWATQFLKSQAWPHLISSSAGDSFTFSLPKTKPSVTITELCCSDDVEEQVPASSHSQAMDDPPSMNAVIPSVDTSASQEPHISAPSPASKLENNREIQTPSPNQSQDIGDPIIPSKDPQASNTSPAPKKGIKRGKKLVVSEFEVRRSERLHILNKGFKPSVCKDKNCLGYVTKPPLISPSVVHDLGTSFCKMDPNKLTDEKLHAKPAAKKVVSKPKAKKTKKSEDKKDEAGTSGKPGQEK